MEEEIWKDVIGYEGSYQVSSIGRVRSLTRKVNAKNGSKMTKEGRLLNPGINSKGYRLLTLQINGVWKSVKLHRLVCSHFKPNDKNLPEINHIDGDKLNNHINNLEWCDRRHNMQHASINGLFNANKGAQNHQAKLTEEQ